MREKQRRKFPSIRSWAVSLEVLFLGLVTVVAWVALQQHEEDVRSDTGDALDAMLETSHEALKLWADQRQHDVSLLAADPVLVGLTQQQLAVERKQEILVGSVASSRLRELFQQRPDGYGGDGFFLIAPDGTSIASMRDQNIGTPNLVWSHRRSLLDRVFAGESVFVPPMESDVPVANSAGVLTERAPTLFFAAPVRDQSGVVIAALSLRHVPGRDFSRIAELARVGVTGETYAFDERGRMLTSSRFEDELRRTGQLGAGEESILSVRVTRPGDVATAADRAGAGQSAGSLDYRGISVLGSRMWSERLGLGLATEIDESEALAQYHSVRRMIVLVLSITVALALLLTLLAVRVQKTGLRKVGMREERLRAVLDTAVDGIITFDEERRVESANPAALEMFGLTLEEIVGKDIGNFVRGPDGKGRSLRCPDLSPGKENVCRCEYVGHRADGTTFELEVGIGDSLLEGERLFTGVFRDVSTRRQLESQLMQSQKLEAVGQLAAGVAHDFNNLLMGIGGCASIAVDRLEETNDARIFVEHIRDAAKSGAAISQQLLVLARKNDSLPQEESSLQEIIATAEPMLTRLLGEDIRLKVTTETGAGIPRCAGGQIEQIIINLAVNARDAMSRGGDIDIATWQERFAGDHDDPPGLDPGRYVALSVVDKGCGMDSKTQKRVFEPFYTTKPIGKGTGLGLSSVYSIVKANGGTILLSSEVDVGTNFTIFLPWAGDASSTKREDTGVGRLRAGTALLVEDDTLVRMTVHAYLQEAGFRVVEAKDGEEALRVANYEAIDLLVSDTVLPGLSGAEVAEAVTTMHPGVPVVMMSAHPAEYLSSTGRIEAGTPILQKPFTRRQLLDVIPIDTSAGPEVITLANVAPLAEAPADALGVRVLLVEDNAASRLATGELLRDKGIVVMEAASGNEALRVYRQDEHKVDVLVADIGLPDMSIGHLIGELNEIRPIRHTVYVSGRSEHDPRVQDLLGDEEAVFLPKPVDIDELARSIRNAPTQSPAPEALQIMPAS